MKKSFLLRITGLLVVVAMLVTMTACMSGGNGDSGAATADKTGTYNFKLTMHDPDTSRVGEGMKAWAQEVSDKTDGKVNIEVVGAGQLAGAPDALDAVKNGTADFGWIYTMFNPGQFTLTEVVSIPMAGITHPVQTANILWDLYESTPELQAELNNGFKMLEMYGNPVNFISTTKTPINTIADIQGMALRCPAGGMSEVMAAWGGNPINVPAGEAADALQKGTIVGTSWEWQGIEAFKLYEQLNYYMDMPIYEGVFVLAMNQDKYDSLPDEYKKVIDETTGREGSIKFGQLFFDAGQESKEVALAGGGEMVNVAPEAVAEFKAIADEWAAGWADKITAEQGIDGKAYLEKTLELAKTHEIK